MDFMTQFHRRTTVYFVVVGLICGTVICVALILLQRDLIPGLTMCGHQICYLDIVPGKTTFENAKQIIESNLATSGYKSSQTIINEFGLPGYSGSYEVSSGPIYSIDLFQNADELAGIVLKFRKDSYPSLAKIIATMGRPSSITVRSTIAQWMNYPSGSFILPVWDTPIIPFTPAIGVYLSSSNELIGACDTVDWHGFDLYPLPPC